MGLRCSAAPSHARKRPKHTGEKHGFRLSAQKRKTYPPANWQFAMENVPFIVVSPIQIVIFHGKILVYQTVYQSLFRRISNGSIVAWCDVAWTIVDYQQPPGIPCHSTPNNTPRIWKNHPLCTKYLGWFVVYAFIHVYIYIYKFKYIYIYKFIYIYIYTCIYIYKYIYIHMYIYI